MSTPVPGVRPRLSERTSVRVLMLVVAYLGTILLVGATSLPRLGTAMIFAGVNCLVILELGRLVRARPGRGA